MSLWHLPTSVLHHCTVLVVLTNVGHVPAESQQSLSTQHETTSSISGTLNPHCTTCGDTNTETEYHLFFECPYSQKLQKITLDKINNLHSYPRLPSISPQSFFHGNLSHANPDVQNILLIIICSFLHIVWLARCSAIFNGHIPTVTSSAKHFYNKINSQINTLLFTLQKDSPENLQSVISHLQHTSILKFNTPFRPTSNL